MLGAYTAYEYKLRRFRPRKIRKEEAAREIDDLESFSTYAGNRRPEDKDYTATQNVVLRRHLRKKEVEFKVRKAGMEAEAAPPQDGGRYTMEVHPVKEKEANIMYTFDMVQWERSIEKAAKKDDVESKLLLDQDFDILKWEESIVYDDKTYAPNRTDLHLVIDANDKNLLFDIIDKDALKEKKTKKKRHFGVRVLSGKYNISGDKNYAEASEALKSALGIQGVQHSIPALKLSSELYKTYLSKEELRSFHRPPLHIPMLSEIRFQPLVENTAKPSAILKKKKELTLRDTADFVLVEYSEEIPPLLANPGMASIITTFFRKSTSKDVLSAEPEAGGVTVLEPKDPSPFVFIGDVASGESVSALVNNLFKAPIFFHASKDLLAIRTKGEKPVYYLRPIDTLACTGQTLVMDEVFSPHSRRHNVFCKNRLKVAAYRIFYEKGNKERKMLIHQLDAMFPHFSEGSKRKWLKEYSECVKKGKDNIWVLKPSAALLSEEDLRRAVTPEQVCQYESMLAEERRLKDAGVVLTPAEEEGAGEEEALKLAVWNCTRNFVNATAGKGLLELTGAGDPTGIGEGFSFVKARKREKEAEDEGEKKTTTEQLQQYKDEIKRIWDLQLSSLRSTKEPKHREALDTREEKQRSTKKTVVETKPGKVLSITRVTIQNDRKCQETEIVTDPRIIEAYLKARKRQRREETRTSLRCGSCGQVGHMKTNKSCMNYKGKSAERKRERKKSPAAMLCEIILGIVKELFAVPFSIAFHRPVSLKKFPNYQTFIKKPIDLTTIKTRARAGGYKRYAEFADDVRLMNTNCNQYNGAGHSLTKISGEMVDMVNAAYEKNLDAIAVLEEKGDGQKVSI
ncbi:transcription initiation factor TFIID subunit 1 [Nematocida displodere]|uniref:Transcription initiation factor TFIID subunit 1 n=1 Tax=Nematocida displodere TaxID=1805483 RepID=A0A177ECN9_9MICR|nr:transcription initiation factor TFIID subunit 1 [Nematocida displodere]